MIDDHRKQCHEVIDYSIDCVVVTEEDGPTKK